MRLEDKVDYYNRMIGDFFRSNNHIYDRDRSKYLGKILSNIQENFRVLSYVHNALGFMTACYEKDYKNFQYFQWQMFEVHQIRCYLNIPEKSFEIFEDSISESDGVFSFLFYKGDRDPFVLEIRNYNIEDDRLPESTITFSDIKNNLCNFLDING
jgi:hypothetical protein